MGTNNFTKGVIHSPSYESDRIAFYEWPDPAIEIEDKKIDAVIMIRNREDAIAVRDSLNKFIEYCDGEF